MATSKEPKSKKNRVLINGIWYWRFTRVVGKKQNARGEWVNVSKAFLGRTKEEALAKIDTYLASNELTRDKSIGELIDWWTQNIYLQDDSIAERTRTLHINSYHNIFDGSVLLGETIEAVSGTDLQAVFSASDKGATSQRHARSFLRRFYKYLMAQNLVTNDATQALIIPKPKKKKEDQSIDIFSDEDLRTFLDKTPENHRLRLLIVLAIYSGARIGELLALTYEDIENHQMRVNKSLKEISPPRIGNKETKTIQKIDKPKTNASVRTIPLEPSDYIDKEIKRHKAWHQREMLQHAYRTNQVFTTSNGNLYYMSSLRTHFERLCASIGIEPKGFHTFRRTFGTRLARSGESITTLSRLMGHDSVTTTAKYYVNIDDEAKRSAVKKLAL